MNTQNYVSDAARSADHSSLEVLTAAQADAIVGGGLWDDIKDFAEDAYDFGKKVYKGAKEVYKGAKEVYGGAKKAVKFLKDLF